MKVYVLRLHVFPADHLVQGVFSSMEKAQAEEARIKETQILSPEDWFSIDEYRLDESFAP
jgi:hypothetical protein